MREVKPKRKRGPKTARGKKAGRHNAITHGISATCPVIPGIERESEWLSFLERIVESQAPEGALQQEFAGRIASLLWRLHRVPLFEASVLARDIADTEQDLAVAAAYAQGTLAQGVFPEVDPARVARAQLTRLIPDARTMERILRYETTLHRQLFQTLHEFEALQARRAGKDTPLSRHDFSGPPNLGPYRSASPQVSDLLAVNK